jgi:hypothetical protein
MPALPLPPPRTGSGCSYLTMSAKLCDRYLGREARAVSWDFILDGR